ncbi:hypothetical protein CF66_3013 [Candidatus Photodesmus katoptron]|uniref:Outer membrane protein beta-barrel domain-containing protein n=1 Tax=Candidatus Photodesmus katoptron Akat1 TaxID=1236703 RepID=S3EH14_9GAMM|nr:hypothetical protein [Candidatus Photodesmus katoptron]EPE37463.1 hypothetical protein O1U_0766 [Candidatus Photodesmus katoptron Akat1]KEY90292.1 hypothetical protein CF66_3013 [Candidatus Photodesmus katoptron]
MFQVKKISIVSRAVLSGLSLLSFVIQANTFNYNYFEIRTGFQPEMAGLELSTLLTENSHFVARIDSELQGDWDTAIGVGFNGPINKFSDIYGQFLIHYLSYPLKINPFGKKIIEKEINFGGRFWLTEKIEAIGRIGRVSRQGSVFHVGARFHSTEELSISAEMRKNANYRTRATISVRFEF